MKRNEIGINKPLYFIADIAANHDGDINRAFKLIELAKESGAHAAKFQNFNASKIVSRFGFEKWPPKVSHQSNWKNLFMKLIRMPVYRTIGLQDLKKTWRK